MDTKKTEFEYRDVIFSKQQAQIIGHILRGKTVEAIATRMNRSPRTIEKHVIVIRNILECENKMDMVEKSFELGYIELMFMELI